MTADPLDENRSPLVVDGRHESVIVAFDVEHDPIGTDDARACILLCYVCWRSPIRGYSLMKPGVQWGLDCPLIFVANQRFDITVQT